MPASIILPEEKNFGRYLFNDKENLLFLFSFVIVATVFFVIFKRFYPNPNIIFDSYYYLSAVTSGTYVNTWPIGYSLFVRIIGVISHSINLLVALQYLFINFALILFFFTVKYFFYLGRVTSIVLIFYLLFNPIYIYTSNLILSDTLFTTLSILWITILFWTIFRPGLWLIVCHATILLLVFTVRYNALYYPFVAGVVIVFSSQKMLYKIIGLGLQFLFISLFILFTIHKTNVVYGVKQFSPFGGWKLANNALYMYKNVRVDKSIPIPERFKDLQEKVHNYFSTEKDTMDLFTPDLTSGSYYMYIYPSPLLAYRNSVFGNDNSALNPISFAKLGPLYQDYGAWLIRKYPLAFGKYFLWPNVQRYFISPPEVYTDNYNPFSLRMDSLGAPARKWFGVKSISAKSNYVLFRYKVFMLYPMINIIIHVLFILLFVYFIIAFNGSLFKKANRLPLLLIGMLWICDFIFNVSAAAIVLRYQLFISTVEFTFFILFLQAIYTQNDKIIRSRIVV